MKRVVVDPVTRIEGHLRVELEFDEASGKVTDALSSGTAWRGLEVVLRDRDPRDAWAFAQRICGVCTTAHALAALRAAEDALDIKIPKNANYIRNVMAACQTVHDHVVHFYHLHALDWVNPLEALKADPAATARLQNTVLETYVLPLEEPVDFPMNAYPKDFPKATPDYFKTIQDKIKQIADSGQLGIFSAHWWDHPDYLLLEPEVHLLAIAHYFNMLDKQREIVIPHVVFGGKNPHPHYVVGGMPCAISMNDMNAPINTERLAVVDTSLSLTKNLVKYFYMPDLLAIGHAYVKRGYLDGAGLATIRVLGCGDYPDEPYSGISNGDFHKQILLHTNGVVENFGKGVMAATFIPLEAEDLSDPAVLTEGVEHSWFKYVSGVMERHPWEGETEHDYTGPKEGTKSHWKYLDENGKYSWIKTPKWRGKMVEVGPLARYIIVYTKVKQGLMKPNWAEEFMISQMEAVTKIFGVNPEVWMGSTVGRTVIRGMDAQLHSYLSKYFFDKLIKNIDSGDLSIANDKKWNPVKWPQEGKGVGLYEAPRGALSHWMVVKNSKISNYQAVVPTTWNGCPRDSKAGHGAYEQCMIDTKIKIPEKPLEILRAIRSFDPCLACATHLYDASGKTLSFVNTDPYNKGGW